MAGLFLLLAAFAGPALADSAERTALSGAAGAGDAALHRRLRHVLASSGWPTGRSTGRTPTAAIRSSQAICCCASVLDARSEVQVGLTAFGRTRDRIDGVVSKADEPWRHDPGLQAQPAQPRRQRFSVAVQPFVTLPTGGAAIGAGDWGGGLVVPVGVALSDKVSLELTPRSTLPSMKTARPAFRRAGRGRLSFALSPSISSALEIEEVHDADPAGTQDHALAGLAFALAALAAVAARHGQRRRARSRQPGRRALCGDFAAVLVLAVSAPAKAGAQGVWHCRCALG